MSRSRWRRTSDCGGTGAAHSRHRVRTVPVAASPTPHECVPSPERHCPDRDVPPIAPHLLTRRPAAAVRLLPPGGTESLHSAPLLCESGECTIAACEGSSSLRLLIGWLQN